MGSKFLIDECLSPDLATLARQRGFAESSHVTWLGKAGWKDWELKHFILDEDWTFVTRNSSDVKGGVKVDQCGGAKGSHLGPEKDVGLAGAGASGA